MSNVLRSSATILKLGRRIAFNNSITRWHNVISPPTIGTSFLPSRWSSSDVALKKTALYDAHLEHEGKMVDFAGYALPVQYKDNIQQSHLHARSQAAVFDVSHMGQILIRGQDRVAFIESLIVGDIEALKENQGRLSLLTSEEGGILDDLIVTKKADHLYVVVNGACKVDDLKHMRAHLKIWNEKHDSQVEIEYVEDRSLIALQGPKAVDVLQKLVDQDLSKLGFMFALHTKVGGFDCWVGRCGYTGEDGFEISVENKNAISLLQSILSDKRAKPTGLAVRDTLRLEAGLCLYGHDLDTKTTPNEGGLLWTISKRRRKEGGFPGHSVVMKQLKERVSRRRVGILVGKGPPAREGAEILSTEGEKIGTITSGTFSPSLKKKIAMGYINRGYFKKGTKVAVKVRNKVNPATVVGMPFVPSNYYFPKK